MIENWTSRKECDDGSVVYKFMCDGMGYMVTQYKDGKVEMTDCSSYLRFETIGDYGTDLESALKDAYEWYMEES